MDGTIAGTAATGWELLRGADAFLAEIAAGRNLLRHWVRLCLGMAACSATYGAVLGYWHGPELALYSAIKLPGDGRDPCRSGSATSGSRHPRGTFIRVPAGMIHDFENRTSQAATLFNVFLPGGFEPMMPAIVSWFAGNAGKGPEPGP